jgi:hypothetical protein
MRESQYVGGMILSSLPPAVALLVVRSAVCGLQEPVTILTRSVNFDGLPSSVQEIQHKEHQQRLGNPKRNGNLVLVQHILVHPKAQAHRLIAWFRR